MNKLIRVLHILTSLDRGGIETLLMTYYRKLDRNEIQFDFLLHREGTFAYSKEVEDMGGIIYQIPPYNPFSAEYHRTLDLFFKEHKYDIVHSHMNCLSAIPLKYAKKHGVENRIAHSHIIINSYDLKSLYKKISRHFIKFYATHYFACSVDAGKWMFGEKSEFVLMKNAIDANKYIYNREVEISIRKILKIEDDCVLLGHVGRLTDQKNQEFLFNVLYKLCKNGNYHLVLIGEGENKEKLKSLALKLMIENKVTFLGSVPNVNDYLQAMDIFVFPSKFEGLGIVAVEAQAAGICTICSEYVPKEVKIMDECLFLPLNEGKWVECIKKHKNGNKRDTFIEVCNSHYDINDSAKDLVDRYKSMSSREEI